MRIAAVLVVVIGIAGWGLAAGESTPSGVTVEVLGLRIVKPAPGSNDRLRAFNWRTPGTTVALLLTVPQGGLVAFDREASKVTAFIDDKGKDLTKSEVKNNFGRDAAAFEMMPTISKDGKQCSAEVSAPGVPTRGCATLTVSGEAALQVATQKKDFTAEKVALKPGTRISAGAIGFTIERAGKPEWGDEDGFSVALQAKQKLDSIADVQFFDAAGKQIEANRTSTRSMESMNDVTVTWTYRLKSKVDSAKIVFWYWTDKRKITVPINLTIGMGL